MNATAVCAALLFVLIVMSPIGVSGPALGSTLQFGGSACEVGDESDDPPCDNEWGFNFDDGTLIYDPPADFCDYFHCIGYFWSGTGYVVQCFDSSFSHSGGRSGACSYHEGEFRPLYDPN